MRTHIFLDTPLISYQNNKSLFLFFRGICSQKSPKNNFMKQTNYNLPTIGNGIGPGNFLSRQKNQ